MERPSIINRGIARMKALLGKAGVVPSGHLRCRSCAYAGERNSYEHEERKISDSSRVINLLFCPKCGDAMSRSTKSK
jgi:DNA-directed RNA polymerase subunit M/transcription elongation factor TFIIS